MWEYLKAGYNVNILDKDREPLPHKIVSSWSIVIQIFCAAFHSMRQSKGRFLMFPTATFARLFLKRDLTWALFLCEKSGAVSLNDLLGLRVPIMGGG